MDEIINGQEIHKSFAILGLGKFGYQAAISLYEHGAEVIAVDKNESLIQKISMHIDKAVCADLLDWDALEHNGAFEVDVVIIGLRESFEATVLIVNHLKTKTKIKKIIALVDSEEKAEVLRIMGIDRVIFPENEIAQRMVQRLTIPNLVNEIAVTPDTRIIEITCPPEFIGSSLIDLEIRSKYQVYVISIVRGRENEKPVVLMAPHPQTVFEKNDKIVCLGTSKNLVDFTSSFK
ncbi:MAG: TrkA family potassium uptake protein [Spirochaetia bacterium]|nr:TrkA family potassium uptake protein [Spirochaetia bacterium]